MPLPDVMQATLEGDSITDRNVNRYLLHERLERERTCHYYGITLFCYCGQHDKGIFHGRTQASP